MLPKLKTALELLEKDKQSLLNRISELSDDQLKFQPAENEWSIGQVIEHLMLVEKITLFSVRKNLARAEPLKPAGLKAKMRQVMLLQWLKSDKKTKAPGKSIEPSSEEQPDIETVLEDWRGINTALVGVLENLTKKETKPCVFKHPITGYINIYQTLAFLRGHLNHHLMQIDGIKAANLYPVAMAN